MIVQFRIWSTKCFLECIFIREWFICDSFPLLSLFVIVGFCRLSFSRIYHSLYIIIHDHILPSPIQSFYYFFYPLTYFCNFSERIDDRDHDGDWDTLGINEGRSQVESEVSYIRSVDGNDEDFIARDVEGSTSRLKGRAAVLMTETMLEIKICSDLMMLM